MGRCTYKDKHKERSLSASKQRAKDNTAARASAGLSLLATRGTAYWQLPVPGGWHSQAGEEAEPLLKLALPAV